jgi:hypothetical protein
VFSRLHFIVAMVGSVVVMIAGGMVIRLGGEETAPFGWVLLIVGILAFAANLAVRFTPR